MDCINLQERFGRQYSVICGESYRAHGPDARRRDPWLTIIPCRFGHLYPFGGEFLAASVDGFPKVAGRLRKLPCCRVHQDGDDGELTVVFHVNDLARVAGIIRPRCRRKLSPERRAELADRMRAIRKTTPQAQVTCQYTAQGCDPSSLGDQLVVSPPRAVFGL